MHPLLQRIKALADAREVHLANHKVQSENSNTLIKESVQITKQIELDYETFVRLQNEVAVATYGGWNSYGRQVRAGEKSRTIQGVKVFHITQTTELGE